MVNVLHVITGLGPGGAEMVLSRLCSRMDRQRFPSMVVSLRERGINAARIERAGVPLVCLDMSPSRPTLGGLAQLVRVIREFRPSVVQGWMYHGNMAALFATRLARLRTPVVWNVRASLTSLANEATGTYAVIRGGALLSRRTAGIIYNSSVSAVQHERIGFAAARSKIIVNGFDDREFRPDPEARAALRRALGIGPDELLVGCVGRDHPMKDHAGFVRAAAIAASRDPRLRFVIAGEGVDDRNADLVAIVRESGLGGRLQLLGARDDMPRLYASLDIACLSSAWGEGFPNVLGEAMACGVPCVTTDVGESGVIVADTGRVVGARDMERFAAAICELAQDERLRAELGEAARRRVLDTYSLDAVTGEYERYYEAWN